MRDEFAKTIFELARKNNRVMLIIGDTGAGLFDEFKDELPGQFLNAGIAEANMITVAAGLAKAGFIPFVYAIGPHMVYRAYEQIRNDLCFNSLNVKIVSVGSGLHYSDHGPTHHSTEDFGVLRVLPNIKIFSPSCGLEVEALTSLISKDIGPSYLRLGRGDSVIEGYNVRIGKGIKIKEGDEISIIATGSGVHDSFILSEEQDLNNISLEIINIHTIKPLDEQIIINSIIKTKKVITIEEHQKIGGLGDAVASIIADQNMQIKLIKMGIDDTFCSYIGGYDGIKKQYGLGSNKLKENINNLLQNIDP
jgi:transketolase